MNERKAMAILVSANRIGYAKRELALKAAGSAENLLADPYAAQEILGEAGIASLRTAMKNADRMLDHLFESGAQLLVRGEAGYPKLLTQTAGAPHLLFCMGKGSLDDPFPLGIVGTRKASAYGLRHTRAMAAELARSGMTIVSGMALGIDAASHWGALDADGRTIAVLGSALDRPYPPGNKPLMQEIIDRGGSVVSEYPPGTEPTKYSFIQRNRIVAGMSLGVLVTEAPMRSGARYTAQFALDDGREVFALPGDIDRDGSGLPNRLISEGAHVAVCAKDVLGMLIIEPQPRRIEETPKPAVQEERIVRKLDAQEQAVYDLLLQGDLDFDALSERTGIAPDELGGLLMMLELDGIVTPLPGRFYRLS